jgi:hypothetical protein
MITDPPYQGEYYTPSPISEFRNLSIIMSAIYDIAINLAASAIWALGGFVIGYIHLKKSISRMLDVSFFKKTMNMDNFLSQTLATTN